MNKWIVKNKLVPKEFDLQMLKNILLANRNLVALEDIGKYLEPSLSDLEPEKIPLDKAGMDKAAKRILSAKQNGETVVVYTDYDADGICAGAIIWEELHKSGIKAWPYIPDRIKEGYGLSESGIEYIIGKYSPGLVITVDHGVSAAGKIKLLTSRGIDVIVLDHHVLPEAEPIVTALVHTTQMASGGIALVFAKYLREKMSGKKQSLENLDLAAIATISDLVPLVGPNRIITKFGLEEINHTKRPGLKALIQEAGLESGDISTYEVSHILGPRINAVGRMTHGLDALRLICTKDIGKATLLAKSISGVNKDRQLVTEETYTTALLSVKQTNNGPGKMIFISHESFREGVIGLVAGKLVEEFCRPAIVVSEREVYCKASARSVKGINIIETLRRFSDILVDIGGHPMAAGFTVERKNLEILKRRISEFAEAAITQEHLTKNIEIDTELDFRLLDKKLLGIIRQFEPFGSGNPQPVFCSYGLSVVQAKTVGKDGKHLKLKIAKKSLGSGNVLSWTYPILDAIGFGMGKLYSGLSSDTLIDAAYTLEENVWNGEARLQLKLKDVIMH